MTLFQGVITQKSTLFQGVFQQIMTLFQVSAPTKVMTTSSSPKLWLLKKSFFNILLLMVVKFGSFNTPLTQYFRWPKLII